MDITFVALVLLAVMVALLSSGLWVAISLMGVGLLGLVLFTSVPAGKVMATTIWGGSDSWPLTALPLFIWMAEILFRTRMSDDIFKTIADACGVRPIGWHTRSPHTPNTRRLLIAEGGFLYDSDAYDDDLPYLLDVGGGRQHVVLPYSLDTNDMRCQRPEAGFVRAQDFADYVIDAFDWLWDEGATSPRMMTVGLHLRTIGRPGRIAGLDRVLRHIRGKGGAWIARRDEIARHWLRVHGRASATPA